METRIKSPAECNSVELDAFQNLVIEGGQVNINGLRARIENAAKLIFVYQEDQCVAIAALKNPNKNYKNRVFDKANTPFESANYIYELGWLFSKVKGVGNMLMEAVLEASGINNAFATTREDNGVMQYLLPKYGFNKLGDPYNSSEGDYQLGLFGKKS